MRYSIGLPVVVYLAFPDSIDAVSFYCYGELLSLISPLKLILHIPPAL